MVLRCICINPVSVFQEGGVYEYQFRRLGSRSNLPNRMYVVFPDRGEKVYYTNEEYFLKTFSKTIDPIEDFRANIRRLKKQIRE